MAIQTTGQLPPRYRSSSLRYDQRYAGYDRPHSHHVLQQKRQMRLRLSWLWAWFTERPKQAKIQLEIEQDKLTCAIEEAMKEISSGNRDKTSKERDK